MKKFCSSPALLLLPLMGYASGGEVDRVILFDRRRDPFELKNIAPEPPGSVAAYTGRLKEWLKRTNDPFLRFWKNSRPISDLRIPNT